MRACKENRRGVWEMSETCKESRRNEWEHARDVREKCESVQGK